MNKTQLKDYFNKIALQRDRWKRKNKYYHQDLENFFQYVVPKGSSVLEIGCATGDILAVLSPQSGVGIDFSESMIALARKKHLQFKFEVMDVENISFEDKYDYIILSDLIGFLKDIERAFEELHKVSHSKTRLVITYYNFLWAPILKLAEKLHLAMPQPWQSWLNKHDIKNMLYLSGFEVVKEGERLLFPKYIPLFSTIMNRYFAKLPILRRLCLVNYIIARPIPLNRLADASVSVLIPARNEAGNIEQAIMRVPDMGLHTEIIFVEGNSKDNTREEIKRCQEKYINRDIKFFIQSGKGKGDAVRLGFDKAGGDILMILDADLTVPPEDLPKFYEALVLGKGEFINGSRLVYPLEKDSMRFLNILGNKFFSMMFSWLLDQRLKDTLCGTKVLLREDYEKIKKGRKFFGDFDPFGDFDLIFGAAKLNLKIVDLPIRYQERTYGSTQISRFSHGWLLLKMCAFAMRKIKFI